MSATSILIGKSRRTADGKGGVPIELRLSLANRHGLIAGATGTGKTVTLQRLAESFSRAGVPVFTADVKGDVAGLSQPGSRTPRIDERLKVLELETFEPRGVPTLFWDVFGEKGHHLRTTVEQMGPLLLARTLELNETQTAVLEVAFAVARRERLPLVDPKDLRALLSSVDERRKELERDFGNMSTQSLTTIQRALVRMQESGGERFFGEPALAIEHLLQRDFSGAGVVSILDARSLFTQPRIYTSFLVWLLSTLFERLPEVGDKPQPELVFFFDEAHLFFEDAPRPLLERMEQIVRLVRSKGVGIYFVTQHPDDIPEDILGQLGNRVQHALRAFTPRDEKAVRVAAETFRKNATLDTAKVITELEVGEALVSVLDERGAPTPVERVLIAPPCSRLGPISEDERKAVVSRSPIRTLYEQQADRESASEILSKRSDSEAGGDVANGSRDVAHDDPGAAPKSGRTSNRQTVGEAFTKSLVRAIGAQLGRTLSGAARILVGGIARNVVRSITRRR